MLVKHGKYNVHDYLFLYLHVKPFLKCSYKDVYGSINIKRSEEVTTGENMESRWKWVTNRAEVHRIVTCNDKNNIKQVMA